MPTYKIVASAGYATVDPCPITFAPFKVYYGAGSLTISVARAMHVEIPRRRINDDLPCEIRDYRIILKLRMSSVYGSLARDIASKYPAAVTK